MNGLRNPGRVAGLWYLSVIVFGIFAEVLRSTVSPLEANATILRVGFVSDLVMMISFLFVGLSFFRLFRSANENWAGVLATFVVLGVAINMAGLAHYGLALNHLTTPAAYTASVEVYRATYDLANVFFGLWLLPLGILVGRSALAPRWLGSVALVTSAVFTVDGLVKFLAPDAYHLANPFLSGLMVLGEFTITGWLVARGSRSIPS